MSGPSTPSPVPARPSPRWRRAWIGGVCAGLAACLGAMPALGAPPAGAEGLSEDLEAMQGRPVRRVVLRQLSGGSGEPGDPDEATARLVRNQLRLREGSPYQSTTAQEDIGRLNRLGPLKDVESRVQLLEDGSVNIIYTFALHPVVRDVQVVGNRLFTDGELRDLAEVLINTPADATQIDRFARRMEDVYRDKGYYNATVSPDSRELEQSGVLIFRVREGDKIRVRDVRFRGNLTFSPRELRQDIKTSSADLISSGRLDAQDLAGDVAVIKDFYRDRGYLDARVDRWVQVSPDGREAIVTFEIDEGPAYTLRSLRADFGEDPNPPLSPQQILGLMGIKPGDVYGEGQVRRSVQTITDAYQQMGFVDARVERRELRDLRTPQVDLLLLVSAGKRYRTGEVGVSGNTITQQKVVLRQLTGLRPDRALDGTAVERSRARLRNTRLFTTDPPGDVRLTIQPPDEREPEHRDVLVSVEETNTGDFSIGGVVSSDGGVAATLSLTQRNFDVQNVPNSFSELFTGGAFRGAGQTFRISILPGDRRQDFSVSLVEPSLAETDYTGSVSAYARRRVYRAYDENRFGGTLGLGRRFGTRWEGGATMRLETVGLADIDEDAPVDYFETEDYRYISSLALTLKRNTYDNPLLPTRGTAISLAAEQAGLLGGDYSYTSLAATHELYLPVSENVLGRVTTLSFRTAARWIPQDPGEAPFYDRFYQGGQEFRGFAFRGISPRGIRNDNGLIGDEPVGGTYSFFLGAELKQPIYEDLLALVFFVDSGTVANAITFDDYRVSVGTGLRLSIPGLSPVPLAFDFGIPVRDRDEDDRRVFTFSVDIPLR